MSNDSTLQDSLLSQAYVAGRTDLEEAAIDRHKPFQVAEARPRSDRADSQYHPRGSARDRRRTDRLTNPCDGARAGG